MKIRVVAVGGMKPAPYRALADDYFGRVKRFCSFEEVEVKPAAPAKELAALRKAARGTVVALDATGKVMDSAAFAKRLDALTSRGKGEVSFLIGGADGIPAALRREADEVWSLSALTFPHRLARVVLAEQIYRALTIVRGMPYDR